MDGWQTTYMTNQRQVYAAQAQLYAKNAKAQIAEFEEITEVNKVAAPKTDKNVIKIADVLPGDVIYLHTLGAGPYLVKDVQIPTHPAIRNSCRTILAVSFRSDYRDWDKFCAPLSYQFTQTHHEVELWDAPKTRETFGLAPVNPRRKVTEIHTGVPSRV